MVTQNTWCLHLQQSRIQKSPQVRMPSGDLSVMLQAPATHPFDPQLRKGRRKVEAGGQRSNSPHEVELGALAHSPKLLGSCRLQNYRGIVLIFNCMGSCLAGSRKYCLRKEVGETRRTSVHVAPKRSLHQETALPTPPTWSSSSGTPLAPIKGASGWKTRSRAPKMAQPPIQDRHRNLGCKVGIPSGSVSSRGLMVGCSVLRVQNFVSDFDSITSASEKLECKTA